MNAFQYLMLTLILALAIVTLRSATRGLIRKRIVVFWLFVWGSSGLALVWPESTAIVARALGIGRGTDLVLYVSVIVMLTGFFYVYSRFRRMDRQMTELVRKLAIDRALPPGPQEPPVTTPPAEPSP